MTKTILFISPFFYPEPISTGKYNTLLARALVDAGYRVLCCSSVPIYPNWIPTPTDERLPGMEIYRRGARVRYPRPAIGRRFVLETWFAFHALLTALQLKGRYSTVVAVFPPSLFFYVLTKILSRGVTKVGIVHDLQGVLGLDGTGIVKRVLAKVIKHVESVGFNACDHLICLSEGMKTRILEDYAVSPAKCSVHYPFAMDASTFSTGNRLSHFFLPGYKHVVYSGALGEKQDPFNLLSALQSLVRIRTDVICHVFSRGPLFNELQKSLAPEMQNRVLFHDLVDESDLYELYARSDIQLIPQKTGTSDGAFPSKLPNLLAAGVPVFAITDKGSELELLLRKSGTCCSVTTWDYREVIPEISNFINRSSLMTHQERAIQTSGFVAEHFSIQKLVRQIIEN